jgi:hypothetical protein
MATSKKATRKKTATKKGPASKEDVGAFMASLEHPLKKDIETVRKLILGVSPAIGEGIKWNAPSFQRTDWFATTNLRSRDTVQLIFHTGAKAKNIPDLEIPDPSGLIKWLAKDRCLVTLGAGKTLKTNAGALEAIVKAWIKYV